MPAFSPGTGSRIARSTLCMIAASISRRLVSGEVKSTITWRSSGK
jgi:hypothetical protein